MHSMPQVLQDNTMIGDIIEEWEVNEYEHYGHPMAWFVIMGSLGSLLLLFSIITGNLLFSAIIILSVLASDTCCIVFFLPPKIQK